MLVPSLNLNDGYGWTYKIRTSKVDKKNLINNHNTYTQNLFKNTSNNRGIQM